METKIYTIEEQKALFLQSLINKVDGKISKVSNNSVLNGVAFGVAKLNQKGMKDVALLEAELFPEYSYGDYLDKIVSRSGVIPRQTSISSSVYVRISAEPGTRYVSGVTTFVSSNGYIFNLEEDVLIGPNGFDYAKLRSMNTGLGTNVPANSITQAVTAPAGHLAVTNELPASGGVDIEDDQSLLNRLLENFNNFAFDTLAKLKSVFQTLNPLVLDVKKLGIDDEKRVILGLSTINGISLLDEDLDYLLSKAPYYLSLKEYPVTNLLNSSPDIVLRNIEPTLVDVEFKVDLFNNVNTRLLRENIQLSITKYLDFRNWKPGTSIQWEELFYIVRNQEGIRSLPEQSFRPHQDIEVPTTSYPRLRGFIMRDMDGNVLIDNGSAIVPYYYSYEYSSNVFNQINTNYGD